MPDTTPIYVETQAEALDAYRRDGHASRVVWRPAERPAPGYAPRAPRTNSHHERTPGAWMPRAQAHDALTLRRRLRGTLPTLDDYDRWMR